MRIDNLGQFDSSTLKILTRNLIDNHKTKLLSVRSNTKLYYGGVND